MPRRASSPVELAELAQAPSLGSLAYVQRVGRSQSVGFDGRPSLKGRSNEVPIEVALSAEGDRSSIVTFDQVTTHARWCVGVAVANWPVGLESKRLPGGMPRLFLCEEIHLRRVHGRRRWGRAGAWRQAVPFPGVPGRRVVGGSAVVELLKQLRGLADLVGAHAA